MSPAPQSRMPAERGTSLPRSQTHTNTNTCTSATCPPPPGLATPGTAMGLVCLPEACQSPAGTRFGQRAGSLALPLCSITGALRGMRGDEGRRVRWAANWGREEEEENAAAAQGCGGERDGSEGEGKRAAAWEGEDRRNVQRVQKEGRRQRAGDGGQREGRAKGSVVPTTLPSRGLAGPGRAGSAQAAESRRGPAGRWVGGRHRPRHPGPAAAPRAGGPSPFPAAPARRGHELAGGTAPLTGGGGAAGPAPPSRGRCPGASHPPRPRARPRPLTGCAPAGPGGMRLLDSGAPNFIAG